MPTSSSSGIQNFSEPKHLWSEDSKFKRSWIRFNSEDYSTVKLPNSTAININSFDSIDIAQMQEVDEYFRSYAASK